MEEKKLWKYKFEIMMTLNGVKRNNRKKHIIVNAGQIPIEFCFLSLKSWFLKKDNVIKNSHQIGSP